MLRADVFTSAAVVRCAGGRLSLGWSSCSVCGFGDHCWKATVERGDVATVVGVDKNLELALHQIGVDTYQQLLDQFTDATLSEFKRPWGNRLQKVGKLAGSILHHARALAEQRELVLQAPAVPTLDRYVMFDLEGLPPQLRELDKIYLWGLGVYGDGMVDFRPVIADFGPDGDRRGWEAFLGEAAAAFGTYGDIPFVHWAQYERTNLKNYIERYGDPNGVAARVIDNLLDLLPVTTNSVVLPLPSRSLKVVEKYIGFQRTQEEYGGDWAMAAYIEAVETNDPSRRDELMQKIVAYNREDLDATWAVLRWLQSKKPGA